MAEHLPAPFKRPPGRLAPAFAIVVVVLSVAPFLLTVAGIRFESPGSAGDMAGGLEHALTESFTHTILEWSAFLVAVFTAILAMARFRVRHDVATAVIGISLFFAGVVDAFHALAASRLIPVVADAEILIPFTWTAGRAFHAMILIIGVSIFTVGPLKDRHTIPHSFGFVVLIGLLSAAVAYGFVHVCATRASLPRNLFPDAIVTRPWDLIPLALFLFAGIFAYPRFHRFHKSLFSYALLISVLPDIAAQIHMAFGSGALYDTHFKIAHALKLLAYMVPLGGLLADYIHTHVLEIRTQTALEAEVLRRNDAEQALRKVEMMWRTVAEGASDHIMAIDRDGKLLFINRTVPDLTPEEVIGSSFYDHVASEDAAMIRATVERVLKSGQPDRYEVEYVASDGKVLVYESRVEPLWDGDEIKRLIVCATDITERRQFERQLHSLASELSLAEERERRRLAQTLHDNISQMLAFTRMKLSALRQAASHEDRQSSFEEIGALLEETVRQTRELTDDLSPPVLYELGLGEAVGWMAETMEKRHGIEVSVDLDEAPLNLDEDVLVTLFHATRELMTNVVKHAQSPRVSISVRRNEDQVKVEVQDFGVGIDSTKLGLREDGSTGFGLFSIRQRLESLGGGLDIHSKVGEGSRMVLRAPLACS